MARFDRQVADFARKVEANFIAIAQESVQETVRLAQRVEEQGGSMRVDTGFLRASIQASLRGMPNGPSQNEGAHGGKRKYTGGQQVAGEPVFVTLLKWNPHHDQALHVGWTANYARVREAKDGFLQTAVQLWDQTVYVSTRKVRNRLG